MDDGESSRRNRKPNYSRDEVLTIICGVQENKFNLLKKSCTVSANKVKQAGWKAICDRLNFFNPDRQRTVEEVNIFTMGTNSRKSLVNRKFECFCTFSGMRF